MLIHVERGAEEKAKEKAKGKSGLNSVHLSKVTGEKLITGI